MAYRYNKLQKTFISLRRKLNPSVNSSYTAGPIQDICAVQLSDPQEMRKFFVRCIELLSLFRQDDLGDYLEFGVFNGASLANMSNALKQTGRDMRQFGFDAFEGLPAGSDKKDAGVFKKGYYSCSFEQLQGCLKKRNVNPVNITWVKGWYDTTLTAATAKQYKLNPGIVLVDCDTYSSAKSALDFIAPLIKQPTVIALDDWRLYDLDLKGEGEYRAFNEFLEANPKFNSREIKSYKRNARSFIG